MNENYRFGFNEAVELLKHSDNPTEYASKYLESPGQGSSFIQGWCEALKLYLKNNKLPKKLTSEE